MVTDAECKETAENGNLINLDRETLLKILDNSYDEIFVIDKDGKIIYVNDASIENYGLKPSDIIGKSVWWFYDEGYCLPTTPVALREKKRVTLETKTSIGKKLVVTSTPVLKSDGEIDIIVANSRDITQIDDIKQNFEETKQLLLKYKQEVVELRMKELVIDDFVAHSKPMRNLVELAVRVAHANSNILITGESGTGKGVMAKYIHKMSKRAEDAFIPINCAAIPEHLLESEFFGYSPGAFTGADKNGKIGLLELANNGTVFLDEIAEIPIRLQAKLLEVIQDHQFIRVGGREKVKVNVRIVAATNRNLEQMVKEGSFREDLYYRLKVIELEMPSLRERPEDILPLIYFYLNQFDEQYNTKHQFAREPLDMLIQYPWPGNIRELEHLIERLVVTVPETEIKPYHLPSVIHKNSNAEYDISFPAIVSLDFAMEQVEKKLILKAYKQLGSSYKVAQALNISQTKANRLIRKYSVDEVNNG